MQFDSLVDWLAWQETLHPSEIELGLERIARVFHKLYPEPELPVVITVAGTNGKGSSVAMLDAIFREAGYKVGKYTSPHLFNYNERIVINGQPVSDEQICCAFERINQARADISLTYFEFGTLAALDIFLQDKLDVIILEVGLGGRLDAVNIIDPDVALITAISLDHTQWLGSDLASIAKEKAGIMRSNKPVVSSGQYEIVTLADLASKIGARLYQVGNDFSFNKQDDGTWRWQSRQQIRSALPLPALYGEHQLENAAGALMVVELLSQQLPISQQAIRHGLMSVALAGRFQIVPAEPVCIFDVAHNTGALKQLARQLDNYPCGGRVLAVLGMLADKDRETALAEIQHNINEWFIAPLATSRTASAEELNRVLKSLDSSINSHCFETVTMAFEQAMKTAQPEDCIVVFGSFYTVAEVMPQRL
ncbi:MAG: bifunctional tetrahydrofolate synthase/dihydrofolate synthase [Gammaproteobacteria bacterium]